MASNVIIFKNVQLWSFPISCLLYHKVAPQCCYFAASPILGVWQIGINSQGYRELGHFENLVYNQDFKEFLFFISKIQNPSSLIRYPSTLIPWSPFTYFPIIIIVLYKLIYNTWFKFDLLRLSFGIPLPISLGRLYKYWTFW